MITIHPEQPAEYGEIRHVHELAFGGLAEAMLVELLRNAGQASIALVALQDAQLVGHVIFSPVSFDRVPETFRGLGLGPVAVLPQWQRQGIGTWLIGEGLKQCEAEGVDAVVVLGAPAYYSRFGFSMAALHGLENEYGAHEEFMVKELVPGALNLVSGMVRYSAEFQKVGC